MIPYDLKNYHVPKTRNYGRYYGEFGCILGICFLMVALGIHCINLSHSEVPSCDTTKEQPLKDEPLKRWHKSCYC